MLANHPYLLPAAARSKSPSLKITHQETRPRALPGRHCPIRSFSQRKAGGHPYGPQLRASVPCPLWPPGFYLPESGNGQGDSGGLVHACSSPQRLRESQRAVPETRQAVPSHVQSEAGRPEQGSHPFLGSQEDPCMMSPPHSAPYSCETKAWDTAGKAACVNHPLLWLRVETSIGNHRHGSSRFSKCSPVRGWPLCCSGGPAGAGGRLTVWLPLGHCGSSC